MTGEYRKKMRSAAMYLFSFLMAAFFLFGCGKVQTGQEGFLSGSVIETSAEVLQEELSDVSSERVLETPAQNSLQEITKEQSKGSPESEAKQPESSLESETGEQPESLSETETAETAKNSSQTQAETGKENADAGDGSESEIAEDGYYTSKEDVGLYIHTYGRLPDNFITKKEAEALGWVSREGNLWEVAPGMSIGGSRFGNYEGLLPDKKGRKWFECDINFDGTYRGAERIVYSNDGLVYYTGDHYESFEQLYE